MPLLITTISIVVIIGFVWLLNKILPFKVCPICAGVSLTWFWLTVGLLSGWLSVISYQLIVAILMGGTVVGIAYQGEKRFKWAEENIFRFKVPVVILGFILVYLALNNLSWVSFAVEAVILTALVYLFFISPQRKRGINIHERSPGVVEDLEEEMKNCC